MGQEKIDMHVQKEWKKTSIEVAEKLGIPVKDDKIEIDKIFRDIELANPQGYRLMCDYLETYKKYSNFIKQLDPESLEEYYQLERDMSEKKKTLHGHVNKK